MILGVHGPVCVHSAAYCHHDSVAVIIGGPCRYDGNNTCQNKAGIRVAVQHPYDITQTRYHRNKHEYKNKSIPLVPGYFLVYHDLSLPPVVRTLLPALFYQLLQPGKIFRSYARMPRRKIQRAWMSDTGCRPSRTRYKTASRKLSWLLCRPARSEAL